MKSETRNETKAPTTAVTVEGITINIPVGSLDAPTERAVTIVNAMMNERNWKLATSVFITADRSLAEDVAYTLDWQLGGHEISGPDGQGNYTLSSRGYYHYIGA